MYEFSTIWLAFVLHELLIIGLAILLSRSYLIIRAIKVRQNLLINKVNKLWLAQLPTDFLGTCVKNHGRSPDGEGYVVEIDLNKVPDDYKSEIVEWDL